MNKLLTKDANCRIKSIDRHVGFVECLSRFVAAGLSADASHLAERAMEEAENYKGTYRDPIPGDVSIETGMFCRWILSMQHIDASISTLSS
jgi:20S proteasome alpha/beta subunit